MSTDILSEYAELLERQYSAVFAERTLLALDNLSTVIRVEPSYRFGLIANDPDDRSDGPQ